MINFEKITYYSAKAEISSSTKTGLMVSAIVVSILGFLVFISIFIKTILMKKKIDKDRNKLAEKAVIEQKGSALGNIPEYIDKAFKDHKIDVLDKLQLINTIYLNQAKNVLLTGSYLENTYLTLKQMTLATIHVEKSGINTNIWNEAVINYPNDIRETPNFANDDTLDYDLIYVVNPNISNTKLFDTYYDKLRNEGMMIIVQNSFSKPDLKLLIKELKLKNIRYEVSKNKAQFLYLIKSNEISNSNI